MIAKTRIVDSRTERPSKAISRLADVRVDGSIRLHHSALRAVVDVERIDASQAETTRFE